MNRIEAVRQALNPRSRRIYLEIGVSQGKAFRAVTAEEKIAVDPAFAISERDRERAAAAADATHYFETTSDAFFANEAPFLEQRGIDVALIDGLHTYRQALRDVENTLRYLRDDGVIFLHDCNPSRAAIACPATSYGEWRKRYPWWSPSWGLSITDRLIRPWTGDVWKAIVELRSTRDNLRIAVLDCDYGVGVVCRGAADSRLPFSAEQIQKLAYADLAADRHHLLNLTPPTQLEEILGARR